MRLFKEVYSFIQQGHIKLIESDDKRVKTYNVTKDFYFKLMLFF